MKSQENKFHASFSEVFVCFRFTNPLFFHSFIPGDILAKSFKWIYAKCFLCRICPNIARRRLAREKHKEKLRQNNGEDPV
jgi:hypothetical protein